MQITMWGNMRSKILLFASLLLFLAGVASAQSSSATLPYYFPPGVQTTTDPILQKQEYFRYINATWNCFESKAGMGASYPEPGSFSVQTKIVSTDSISAPHTTMRLVLDNVVKMPDGRYRVTTNCNQYYITQAQLDYAVKDLEDTVQQAAQIDFNFYNEVYNISVKARADKLGIPEDEFIKQLDDPMPDHPDVTYREFNYLPKPVKVSDFVPRELHLGYMPDTGDGILGETWLNTGIIYYNPEARIVDWLTGKPKVMAHEMVHGNVDFQRFPMSEGFDVELMASLPEALLPENKIDLAAHSYMSTVRELDHIYFGFDFDKMKKDVEGMNMEGNIILNVDKYKYYAKLLDEVQAENLHFFETVTVPEFYSDPIWWSAVNNLRGDTDSVFRITMALHYNPTILGGSKKTMDWLESNKQLILDTAQSGFDAALNPNGGGDDSDSNDFRISPVLIEEYHKLFTSSQRATLEAYYRAHPDELRALTLMKPADAIKAVNKVLGAKVAPKGVVQ